MAPRAGPPPPPVSRPPEASTITPVELACLVQQYLAENHFPKALHEFQTEAGHLISTVRTPKSMRSLTVILSEYISLKAFEAHAAADRARTDQLLRNLYGALEDFRPGSSRDFVPGQSTERAFQQQSLGKENARQAKGKKPRRNTLNGGAPFVIAASAQHPAFLQGQPTWASSTPGIFLSSPPSDLQARPSTGGASPLAAGVSGPQANGSGPSPTPLPGPLPQVPAPPAQQPQGKPLPLHNEGQLHGVPHQAPPAVQAGPQMSFRDSPQPASHSSSLPSPPPQSQQPQTGASEGVLRSEMAQDPTTGFSQNTSTQDAPKQSANTPQVDAAAQDHWEDEPKSPTHQQAALGAVSHSIDWPPISSPGWPPVDSPGTGSARQLRSAEKAGPGAQGEAQNTAEFVTPTKAPRSGRKGSSQAQPSPLKSPHGGRKGTPRKRSSEGKDGPAPTKRVSPNRALFGGQPAGKQDKQPKKALFADALAERAPVTSGTEGQVEGRVSDAGLLDHLDLPGDMPMDEAEFRALVVDTFSKNLDVPSRIADHITQALYAGEQANGVGDFHIPGDATDWTASDGYGLGDACFTDDGIPVDDILAAITADPQVSHLLDSLAATPVSLSGFEDLMATEPSRGP